MLHSKVHVYIYTYIRKARPLVKRISFHENKYPGSFSSIGITSNELLKERSLLN